MSKKILLVEDEEFIRYLYQKQFELSGYVVDTAQDGLQAINKLQHNSQYDLILLDIMMPGMNGIDVLKNIMSDAKTKHIPVIMLTNLDDEDIRQETLKNGASGYWIKARLSPAEITTQINDFFINNTNLNNS